MYSGVNLDDTLVPMRPEHLAIGCCYRLYWRSTRAPKMGLADEYTIRIISRPFVGTHGHLCVKVVLNNVFRHTLKLADMGLVPYYETDPKGELCEKWSPNYITPFEK